MNNARGTNEWADTYGGGFGASAGTQLRQVPLEMLDPWEDAEGNPQKFQPYTSVKLQELAENIRVNGIITPLRVRPRNGRFQIIAGHNRCEAAKLAGLRTVPAIIEELDDNAASIMLVDSNLEQREQLLPSEKAWAYKTKLDAMNRQGKRTDLTSSQNEPRLRTDEALAQTVGESRASIQRYIRLTCLIPRLMEKVDAGKLQLIAGSDVSYLPQNVQEWLADLIDYDGIKVSSAKAATLKKVRPNTEPELRAIMEDKPKPPSIKVALELPDMDELTVAKISHDSDFQEEARKMLADMVKRYSTSGI